MGKLHTFLEAPERRGNRGGSGTKIPEKGESFPGEMRAFRPILATRGPAPDK